jgi:hypothetical protein
MSSPAAAAGARDPAVLRWLPWLVLTLAGAVLTWHAAAGPQLYDAGELAAAAVTLGGSHPPGQPLHSLAGKLVTLLPLGPIALRLSMLSVLCALGAAAAAARLTRLLCDVLSLPEGGVRRLSSSAAMLGVLLSPPVLRQSLRIELYTLALFLFLCAVEQLVRWARSGRAGHLWAAAWLSGLTACVHPPHALAAVLVAASLALVSPRRLLGSPRAVLGALLFGPFALATLAYLPLRARAGAPMWGDPTTLQGFVGYVSGQAFMANVVDHDRLQLALDYLGYLLRVSGGVPAIGALLLLGVAVERRQRPLLGLLLGTLLSLAPATLQRLEVRNPDNVAYAAPAATLMVIAAAAGLGAVWARRSRALAAVGLLLLSLPQAGVRQVGDQLRATVPALDTLAVALTSAPPPRALVVLTTDFAAAAFMMARAVDGARPDVAVFVSGLSTSSWHWQQLASHPGLSGEPVAAPGRDAHERYTRGAIASALRRVPVALERDLPGVTPAAVRGPLAILSAGPARPAVSFDEPLVRQLVREASRGPAGDSGAAAAVVRDSLYRGSQRLWRWSTPSEAVARIRAALWDLPAEQRARVVLAADASATGQPFVVDDPDDFLISREDAVRLAAAELWASGARDAAAALLQAQAQRGDSRSLLQLAHLQAWAGDRPGALRTLQALRAQSPRLGVEAAPLQRALSRGDD